MDEDVLAAVVRLDGLGAPLPSHARLTTDQRRPGSYAVAGTEPLLLLRR